MKLTLVLCMLQAAALIASGQAPGSTMVAATTMLHKNGTRTDSVKDRYKHEANETTFDGRGVVIEKKKFLLNEKGDPTQGTIYDGADNVIAHAQFIFDDLGRVAEERCINQQNEIYQRIIRQYDSGGKQIQSQVVNYPEKAPNMKPAKLNFTQSPGQRPFKTGAIPVNSASTRPGQAPQIETASPGSRTVSTQDVEPAPFAPQQIPQTEAPKEEGKKGSKLNPLNWFKKGR